MHEPSRARRQDIDALRVLATYLLFLFHVAMVFNPAPFFHVRNGEQSFVMLVLAGFISLWHMPLFFLLAGWSLHASLVERGARAIVAERIKRLIVPLFAGCMLFGPAIKYVELRSGLDLNHRGLRVASQLKESFRSVIPVELETAPPFEESFVEFVPTFFTQPERFTWSHLWFLAYLFVLTLVLLPVLARLARRPVAQGPTSPAWVYAPLVPLITIQVLLRPHWPGIQNLYDDWANVAYYATFLVTGFLLGRSARFEQSVHVQGRRAILISLLTLVFLLLAVLGLIPSQAATLAATAVAGWCFIVSLLAAARRYLVQGLPAMAYLQESALPVYILHQPAIVLLGYGIVALELSIAVKFVLLLGSSVALTMAVYHLLVRPNPLLRVLFGMRAFPTAHSASRAHATATVGIALVLSFATVAAAESSPSPLGLWWAEGGAAKVEIMGCGNQLCGEVVWLRSPFDEQGCPLRDVSNPDATRRELPILGLRILRGMRVERGDALSWSGGTIYDPGSGRTYRAVMTLEGSRRLLLRGYVGVPLLGRTTTWIRVGAEQLVCTAAAS